MRDTSLKDVDRDHFAEFFENTYSESIDDQTQPLGTILENMNLMRDGQLNVTGALLLKSPQSAGVYRQSDCVPGAEPDEETYLDSRDITGKLSNVFQQALGS